jgi:hypothetical protein
MSQRRCFLCGQKIRPGAGYRLGRLAGISSDKVAEVHLFHNASCANVWMIWKGHHDRWNGIRWSLGRERMREYGIIMGFAKNFIDSQRPLPDDAMDILDKHLWKLV